LQDDATLWKALEQDMSSENLDADKPTWDFGQNQKVLVSRDPNGAAQIVINADNMMTHPWHLQ
jgi:FtsP/CotA-like multicopper oxidase with cupredoxin domain